MKSLLKVISLVFMFSFFSFNSIVNAEEDITPTREFVFKLDEPIVWNRYDVYLSWTVYYELWRIYDVETYYIYVNDIIYTNKNNGLTGKITKDNINITGLLPGMEYKVEVRPYGGHGVWTASESRNVKTPSYKGWFYSKDNWYYFDPVTGTDKKGWLSYSGSWYYLKDTLQFYEKKKMGTMVAKTWEYVNNKWYYFHVNGVMATGWIEYTDNHGKNWYYLNSDGDMRTGWLYWNNNWYHLESFGGMSTDWKYINGKWYYFYSNGKMAAGTTIQGYKLGKDGAWIQ